MASQVGRSSTPSGNEPDMATVQVLEELENGPEFRQLRSSKLKFIIPATIFFMVYYFALPVLVGFFGVNSDGTPGFMDTRLAPGFSVAYLFALSQFIMAWILAFIYLLAFAPRIDKMVASLVAKVAHREAQKEGR